MLPDLHMTDEGGIRKLRSFTKHVHCLLFLLIRIVSFVPELEYSDFSADLRLKYSVTIARS